MSLPYEYCRVALFAKCGVWWYSNPMLVVIKACADLWRSSRPAMGVLITTITILIVLGYIFMN